jgi:hypothetical protein
MMKRFCLFQLIKKVYFCSDEIAARKIHHIGYFNLLLKLAATYLTIEDVYENQLQQTFPFTRLGEFSLKG